MKQQFDKDCKYQRTHIGPHKADIQIRVNKNDVKVYK
jgi:recombinational DNA repair ATPase RecF